MAQAGKPSRARSCHDCTVPYCSNRHCDVSVMQATHFGEASSEQAFSEGGSWGQPIAASPQALSLTDTEPTSTLNRVFTLTFQLRKGEKARSHVATGPSGITKPSTCSVGDLPSPRKIETSVGRPRPSLAYTTAPAQVCNAATSARPAQAPLAGSRRRNGRLSQRRGRRTPVRQN